MIKFTLNNKECYAEDGEYLLSAAERNGIEIPNLCNHPSVKAYGACGLCLVEVSGVGKLLRACSTKVTEGMTVNSETERVKKARKTALELLMSDHRGDCIGPCRLNCPAETDCQGYIKAIAEHDFHRAVEIIKDKLPLPASIGRVCPHPCEKNCRRQYVDKPLSIAALKAFAADEDLKSEPYKARNASPTEKKVSVIGGGPAGLTVAYYLALKGHSVKIYDTMPQMGGMLRYGIPAYRLPKNILDAEIELIRSHGIEFYNNVKIGRDISFDEVKNSSDATVIAVGAWKSSSMRIPGEDQNGVIGGIDFLRQASFFVSGECEKPVIGNNVIICGGGNTAMDACRTAVRLGAENVTVVYRRTKKEMPAEAEEIEEAEEEGVKFRYLCNPAEFIGKDGKLSSVKLQLMKLGEPDASGRRSPEPIENAFEFIEADTVIEAIGQQLDFSGVEGLAYSKRGKITVEEGSFATSVPSVFAIGDAIDKRDSIAIAAIGDANKAYAVIDAYLSGNDVKYFKPYSSQNHIENIDFSVYDKKHRIKAQKRSANERKTDFSAVNIKISEKDACAEAERCLSCGCHDYENCKLIKAARKEEVKPEKFDFSVKQNTAKERKLVSIERDNGKCILCSLCVRCCDEVAHKSVLGLVGRGYTTVIKPEFENDDVIKHCMDCGKCVDVCPTGALRFVK